MEKLKTRNEYVGCNNKCRFYADKIEATSYGHWCFVKVINGKVVFNNYSYSSTTSRHQSAVRCLLRELGINIDVNVDINSSLDEYTFKHESLIPLYEEALRCIVQNNTLRIRKKTKEKNNKRIEAIKKEIAALREMGAIYPMSKILKTYKYYKVNRDNKEKFLKSVKKYVGKTVSDKNTGAMYVVKSYNVNNQRVYLTSTSSKRRDLDKYWTWFLQDFRVNKLGSVLNGN